LAGAYTGVCHRDTAKSIIEAVKFLLLIMLLSIVATLPFVWLRRPWAITLWRRAKLVVAIYALVILVSAIVSLIFRWDDIYG
jgi:hypothetical protein